MRIPLLIVASAALLFAQEAEADEAIAWSVEFKSPVVIVIPPTRAA